MNNLSDDQIYISHEGLLLHYEEALTWKVTKVCGELTCCSEEDYFDDDEDMEASYYDLSA